MASIYDVTDFSSANAYVKNDIVIKDSYYRYALVNKAAGDGFIEAHWGGIIQNPTTSIVEPHFFWIPSYGSTVNLEPKVNVHKFGDGYEQRNADGINNNLLKISYTFDKIDDNLAKAISHFLYVRGGVESFLFKPHKAYNTLKRFKVSNYEDSSIFYNQNSIRAVFEEVSN